MDKKLSLELSIEIDALADEIWHVITEPQLVKRFFIGYELDTDWKIGSDIVIKGKRDGVPFEDKGKITEYEYEKRLSFDIPGHGSMSYTLNSGESNTRLTVVLTDVTDTKELDRASQNWSETLENIKELIEGKL